MDEKDFVRTGVGLYLAVLERCVCVCATAVGVKKFA
jgi:hypothetical protein